MSTERAPPNARSSLLANKLKTQLELASLKKPLLKRRPLSRAMREEQHSICSAGAPHPKKVGCSLKKRPPPIPVSWHTFEKAFHAILFPRRVFWHHPQPPYAANALLMKGECLKNEHPVTVHEGTLVTY
jgi:hypothetical protein